MPLTNAQKERLAAEAKAQGVDSAALIREAEALSNAAPASAVKTSAAGSSAKTTDKPLYMYHLPFVTVNEVRTIWLGLDPIAGGDEYAAKFAAAQGAQGAQDVPSASGQK